MKTEAAIKHYGSRQAVADALGIKQPSVQNWGEYPPKDQQMRIHKATGGKLQAEPDVLAYYTTLVQGVL